MARLKALSKPEELSAIPVDQPVLVELEPLPTALADDADASGHDAGTSGPEPDDGAAALQKQLDAAKAATAAAEERADTEHKQRLEAIRAADDARKEADKARSERADTESEAIASGLAAAQAVRDAAKGDLKAAFEAGDSERMADAQERLGRAAADIRDFERAAAAHADRKERDKDTPRTSNDAPQSVEAIIDTMPNLLASERDWLKAHKDSFGDPALDSAHRRAIREGNARGTPEYFAFVEKALGYRTAAAETTTDDNDERNPPVTAPVSRDARSSISGKPTNANRIHLTPDQRQIARDMGISDVAYARGVAQLAANKKSDPEKYSGRTQ